MPLQVSTGSNNLTADNNLNEGKKAVGGWGMREADSIFFSSWFYPAGYFQSLTLRHVELLAELE